VQILVCYVTDVKVNTVNILHLRVSCETRHGYFCTLLCTNNMDF